MNIENALQEMDLPKIYIRNGKDCYYDTYRKKLVPVTPEEEIRQRVARWLEVQVLVPAECMILEQHLSHYGINTKDRADIVIHKVNTNGELQPLAVVECKAASVVLSDRTAEQCFRYADMLAVDYAFITNGIEIAVFHYDSATDKYHQLAEVPTYSQMLTGDEFRSLETEQLPRPTMEQMLEPEVQKQYAADFIIGPKTTPALAKHIINLFEAFYDQEHCLCRSEGKYFRVVEDLGVRILSYGNASGWDFVSPYRSFLVKDNYGNHQILSLGFNAYGNDQTILCVGIDDYKKSHHALQLLVDKYVTVNGNSMTFNHSGKISVGHMGSGSTKELLTLIQKKMPYIFNCGKIELGNVPADIMLTLDNLALTNLVINLFDYALIRDEYRNNIKNKTSTHS